MEEGRRFLPHLKVSTDFHNRRFYFREVDAPLKVQIASVTLRKTGKNDLCEALVRDYVARATRFSSLGVTGVECVGFPTEAALLEAAGRKPAAVLVLLDSTGKDLTSSGFAQLMGKLRDSSTQRMVLAIGPADGWSALGRGQASRMVSFGKMTLPHELARVILAEQVYRAMTILAGHPYHSGH
jgi:23S rRNA (pseudouridine1915-N3)-methyltransferase